MGLFGFGKKKVSPQVAASFGGLMQIKFAVPFFDVFDPRFENYGVPVAIRGSITVKTDKLKSDAEVDQFKQMITNSTKKYVKGVVANCPETNQIPVVKMDKMILKISELIESMVSNRIAKEFDVLVTALDVGEIEIDKTSPGYNSLLKVTQELEEKQKINESQIQNDVARAKADAEIDNLKNTQSSGFSSSASSQSWS